jgi:hypothetical protein
MSEGNRFWTRHVGDANYATHRERGVIAGCVPAVDVFVEMTAEEVAEAILKDPYWKVWNDYRNGVIGWSEWLNHGIHKKPQRSFIKNRAVPIKQNYYIS